MLINIKFWFQIFFLIANTMMPNKGLKLRMMSILVLKIAYITLMLGTRWIKRNMSSMFTTRDIPHMEVVLSAVFISFSVIYGRAYNARWIICKIYFCFKNKNRLVTQKILKKLYNMGQSKLFFYFFLHFNNFFVYCTYKWPPKYYDGKIFKKFWH